MSEYSGLGSSGMLSELRDRIKLLPSGSLSAYVVATGLVAVAALIQCGLQFVAEGVMPFVAFFPAVLFAALVGGGGPGVFAACLSFVIGWWAFLPPRMSFELLGLSDQLNLILYGLVAFLLVWGGAHYHQLMSKLREEERLRRLAVGEIHRMRKDRSQLGP